VALAHLEDSSPEIMSQAARVLGKYGTERAEAPLWNAFEKWQQRYGVGEEKLREDLKKNDVLVEPSWFDREFVRAISSARAWLTDAEKLKRLGRLCVTRACKEEAAQALDRWSFSIRITFKPDGNGIENILVAQYDVASLSALKEKLAQFPEGSRFTWNSFNAGEKMEDPVFNEMRQFLAARGMKLEK
jgi:hypothetical protein